MSISRDHIVEEIKRTAKANGGKPLGRQAFLTETGIRESDWSGRFWARWNDAVKEAGFQPNKLNGAREDVVLLSRFADLALELGHIPVHSELQLKKRSDATFPNDKTFARFGSKVELLRRLYEHCASNAIYGDLLPWIEAILEGDDAKSVQPMANVAEGFVYLVKMGKHYKIGKTYSVPRRHREIALELPEKLAPVHVIRTDDPGGIEAYWHKRFQAKCTNSEWFALSAEDVRIFRKRKFM